MRLRVSQTQKSLDDVFTKLPKRCIPKTKAKGPYVVLWPWVRLFYFTHHTPFVETPFQKRFPNMPKQAFQNKTNNRGKHRVGARTRETKKTTITKIASIQFFPNENSKKEHFNVVFDNNRKIKEVAFEHAWNELENRNYQPVEALEPRDIDQWKEHAKKKKNPSTLRFYKVA